MDTYCEYIVKKKNGGKEMALRALIVVGALVLFLIFMFLGTVVGAFSMITTLLAFWLAVRRLSADHQHEH